jgi:hypothetical protein
LQALEKEIKTKVIDELNQKFAEQIASSPSKAAWGMFVVIANLIEDFKKLNREKLTQHEAFKLNININQLMYYYATKLLKKIDKLFVKAKGNDQYHAGIDDMLPIPRIFVRKSLKKI